MNISNENWMQFTKGLCLPLKVKENDRKIKMLPYVTSNTNKDNEDMQSMQKTPKIKKLHIVVGHLIHNKFYV